MTAGGHTRPSYDEAMASLIARRHALAKVFEDVDVLLTLSAPGAAPKGLASTGDARYNRLWTLMGVLVRQRSGAQRGRRDCRSACR